MNGLPALVIALIVISAAADEYTIAISETSHEALRFTEGRFSGSLAPLYRCVVERANQPYTVQIIPQLRALRMLKLQEVDVVMPLGRTEDRDTYAWFAEPMIEIPLELYTLPGGTGPDSRGLQIATIPTSSIRAMIEARGHKMSPINNLDSGVEMVKRGRVQGVLIARPSALEMATSLQGLMSHSYETLEAGLYVSLSRPELLGQLDLAIRDCAE